MKNCKDTSQDSLFKGELVCYQHRHGYRFSIDSVLLAHFTQSLKRASVLDLGCGCGILALILLYRRTKDIHFVDGIEYQRSLATLAEKNSSANNFTQDFTVTIGDFTKLRDHYKSESFSNVICNPPFYPVGSGRPSSEEETYLAKHQVNITMSDMTRNVFYVLKNKGIYNIIYPADQFAELLSTLITYSLQPKNIRFVYSYPESSSATLVLVECIKNGGSGVKVAHPLYIYDFKEGPYSEEVAKMYLSNSELQKESDVS